MINLQPHIRCSNKEKVKYAIMPGDPERVERIKEFLENTEDIAYNREYKSCIGFYKGIKILVISTGIGGASTAIAVEELHNIGVETLFRIGSCGALQKGIKLGSLIIGNGAVKDDGASKTYLDSQFPAVPDAKTFFALLSSAERLGYDNHCGIIRSHDSFYIDNNQEIEKYWSERGVLGCDMESAALFTVGSYRKIKTASILNVVVEYEMDLENSVNSYVDMDNITARGEKNSIITTLEAIANLEK